MKDFINKSIRIALITALTVGLFANCQFFNKKKEDNNLLLLGLFYLANQQPEWTVSMTAVLRQANGTAIAANNVVTLTENAAAASASNQSSKALILDGNEKIRVFATTAAGGRFTISFRTNTPTTGIQLAYTTLRVGGNADLADDYTVAAGSSTFTFTVNDNEPNSLAQVVGLTNSGVQLTVERVLSVRRGVYNLQNPTVGENVCDGRNVGSPVTKEGTITGAETWSGAILLRGTVFADAPITVQPGTVIFGSRGSSLFVRGANKLTAIGTATNPICWTSANSPGSRFPGDWGGVVVIGNSGGTRTSTTEGTTPQNYGTGSLPGTLNLEMEYNIVEFGGNEVAPGDELNNLSIYSSNSKLTHVQAHRGLDDQFEAWGGQGDWNRLVATGGLDDDYDLDEGFRGTVNNILSFKYPAECGGTASTDPHGFEMDGVHSGGSCAGYGCTQTSIRYFTLIGASITSSQGMRLREGLAGTIRDGVAYGFGDAASVAGGDTGGFPVNSFTLQNVGVDRTIAVGSGTNTGSTASLTGFSIASNGNRADCGFSADKPDFTLTGQTSYLGANGNGVGKYWENWTVYRAR